MTIHTLADIVGDGAKHALAVTGSTLNARRIWLCAHGSSTARFGDGNVGAAQGVELPADVVVTISASDADISDKLPLAQQNVFVPNGTTVTVSFGI
jgi:hypothetical protein